jgi:excisionase family DNA binding protein
MLTSAEACERIGVNRNLLARLIRDGELDGAIKTGDAPNSHYRIPEEAVAAYLERRRVVPVMAAS